jgi:alkaline phosphatase
MKRRDFLLNSSFSALGLGLIGTKSAASGLAWTSSDRGLKRLAKNIIFLVSDGMSIGTLQIADLFANLKLGRHSHWIQYYLEGKLQRGLMDTASRNSYVTDSAAASSAWGGGRRVRNGRLNVGSNDRLYKPILQKFKDAGKGVGCVTTVPITHATPAGFCVNSKSRGDQADIAEQYLGLKFNVMLGGGEEYFFGPKRTDNRNLFDEFQRAGYHVARNKHGLNQLENDDSPVLGVFSKSGLPYSIDQLNDAELTESIPTLAEMTSFAIDQMKHLPNGFVLQVEGGKVDWAAHANDTPALIYDQIAFDDAVKVALDFAEQEQNTLVIITTDHGNANPGLIGCNNTIENFGRTLSFNRSHQWILRGLNPKSSTSTIIERIEHGLGFAISVDEGERIRRHLLGLNNEEQYDEYKLPYPLLSSILEKYTSVGWAGTDHSGDYVELAMFGPGSERLPPFVKNTDLHQFMLTVTETAG